MLSLRRATATASKPAKQTVDFYPCSPCGERHGPILTITYLTLFLSMLSLRRATRYTVNFHAKPRFLSMLSLRRATFFLFMAYYLFVYFYPCSPCGERLNTYHRIFGEGISIHALLAESDANSREERQEQHISIHALLAESDPPTLRTISPTSRFLSMLSLRRATERLPHLDCFMPISIHALLAESDYSKRKLQWMVAEFLSMLSLRRATMRLWAPKHGTTFLSMLSLRRATFFAFSGS